MSDTSLDRVSTDILEDALAVAKDMLDRAQEDEAWLLKRREFGHASNWACDRASADVARAQADVRKLEAALANR